MKNQYKKSGKDKWAASLAAKKRLVEFLNNYTFFEVIRALKSNMPAASIDEFEALIKRFKSMSSKQSTNK